MLAFFDFYCSQGYMVDSVVKKYSDTWALQSTKLINNNACLTANTKALKLSSVCFVQGAQHPFTITADVVLIMLQKLRGR